MFNAMFKKEWTQAWKSFKFVALLIVFAIVGIMSPLVALLTPEILGSVLEEEMRGFTLPEPTAYDSFAQFYSNLNQLGLLIFIILFGSVLTFECSRGTLINLLTKGLSRSIVIHTKALFLLIVWTVAYAIAATLTYFYTIFYWDEPLNQLFGALFTSWFFGVFLISLILFASVLFKNFIVVLSAVLVVVFAFMLLAIHPDIAEWLPNYIVSHNVALIEGSFEFDELYRSLGVTFVATVVMYVLTIVRFKKMEVS